MTFAFPSIFWIGLPLIALPAIIHLLNLRRQQVVPWAAMQFLLDSQQRSKTWINLKELILLLLRTAVMAALVLLLARPALRSGWLNQWLGEPTHHLLLIDDSYSTTDRFAQTSAWLQGREAAQAIVRRVADDSMANRVTILRTSEAMAADAELTPEIHREPLDPEALDRLLAKLDGWQPTATAASLLRGMAVVEQLLGKDTQEQVVVHVIADFRERDLQPSDELDKSLLALRQRAQHLHLVGNVRVEHNNLAISKLEIAAGTPAAGVEVWAELSVANFSRTVAPNVVVEIEQDGQALAAIKIGDIAAGETASQRFRTRFGNAGSHQLSARIDDDAVAVDNVRYLAVDIPEGQRVLLVDGSAESWDSYYVATALGPGGGTRTGWETEIITPDKLTGIDTLDRFAMIALLDVGKVDEASLKRLEQYVEAGGGLFIALGESIDRAFYNDAVFRNGAGLLPVPPALPTQWLPGDPGASNDIQISPHPVLRVFASEQNSFLGLMKIDYYYAATRGWQQQAPPEVEVIAKLAGGAPLIAVRSFGRGRVVEQMTRIAAVEGNLGTWSNWSLNPAFPVLTGEMFAWLAQGKQPTRTLEVDQMIDERLSKSEYTGAARLVATTSGVAIDTQLAAEDAGEWLQLTSPTLTEPGQYELHLTRTTGGDLIQQWSVNPPAVEGNLRLPSQSGFEQKLVGDNVTFAWADSLVGASTTSQGGSLVEALLTILVALLAIEQVFGYFCSYHE